MHKAGSAFNGPLFIVGMPRSGTKLLRDLLNGHTQISIPMAETHFIPYYIKRFGKSSPLRDPRIYTQFYTHFSRTPFFQNMQQKGMVLWQEELERIADLGSWPSVFETILRFYATGGHAKGYIWGDKTPGYINHMVLLKRIFPEAKFLHILRDPRDYALSVNRAWGKSIYRAADRWRETMEVARRTGLVLGPDYKEIFFEHLLEEPEKVLSNVCEFLGLDFISEMLVLNSPSEDLGDAKGMVEVMRNNKGKYASFLTPGEVKRIEEITYCEARELMYVIEFATAHRPLGLLEREFWRFYDGLASARFHVARKGLAKGVSYFMRHHIISSWR